MTAVVDSRAPRIKRDSPTYVTSESLENVWGQPSASHYVFRIEGLTLRGRLIEGTYIVMRPYQDISVNLSTIDDARLRAEIDAWEAASDEDMAKFYEQLE